MDITYVSQLCSICEQDSYNAERFLRKLLGQVKVVGEEDKCMRLNQRDHSHQYSMQELYRQSFGQIRTALALPSDI